MKRNSPMRNFDPARVAHYEKENWIAYYQKDWLRLLIISVSMVKYGFGLSWPRAAFGAYLVARAEIAYAPFPKNDVPKAIAYMRRFYAMLKSVHGESFDVDQAAQLEVNWWAAHRELFGNPANQGLVDALTNLYSAAYGVPKESVQPAAFHRAKGMLYSDQWVNNNKEPHSPLLDLEEQELIQSYSLLRQAVQVS